MIVIEFLVYVCLGAALLAVTLICIFACYAAVDLIRTVLADLRRADRR